MLRLSIPCLLRVADDFPAVTSGTEVRILGHESGKVRLGHPDPGSLGCEQQVDFLECALAGFGVEGPYWSLLARPKDGGRSYIISLFLLTDWDTDQVDSTEYVQGILANRAENIRERQGQLSI